jgi:hypothetical protein
MPTIDLDKHFFINLLFGRIIRKVREWKIKHYKAKKVKSEAKNSPEKMYHLHFKIAIRDPKDGIAKCDNVFDIYIPANGYFYAKKKLERFVVANIDVEVVDFESLEEETPEIKKEETWQQIKENENS